MGALPSIADAVDDPALFAPHFRDRESWVPWFAFNRALFGMPMGEQDLAIYQACTGRQDAPSGRASEAWLVVGRRGGKSRDLALIASYLAAFIDWRPYLAPGERGYIVLIAADRRQCRTIIGYIRAFLGGTAILKDLVEKDNAEELELSNGISIEVATCSYRTIRGRTIIAALCDEVAFWSDDSGANPASEVIASLRPAMASIPGAMLLVASSPYRKEGPLYRAVSRHFGKPSQVLIWKAPTRTMNPNIPQAIVDAAYEEDPTSAASEYGAEFRNDVSGYVDRGVVEGLVVQGRRELLPAEKVAYTAFVDPSGGSSDSMTLAIAHMQEKTAILDAVREWHPPFSPDGVVKECAALLKSYGITTVKGDRYAGEWPRERFRVHGIGYQPSEMNKSEIYLTMLPLLNSGVAELLDHPRIVGQISALERRTARGGRDSIDHPPGSHDDLANAVAGALVFAREHIHAAAEICAPIVVRGGPGYWRSFGQRAI